MDMLKTVYPPKTQFCGGIIKVNYVAIRKIAGHWKANTRGPWATMLTWVKNYKGHYKSLIQHFRLSVAMATDQNEKFVQLLYAWWRTTQQTFIKMFCQNICSEIAIKTYFHFSHYKLSYQRKHMINGNKKKTNFIEANVMIISAKFQLHPPYSFWGNYFLIFFRKFSLLTAMETNQIQQFGQNSYAL